MRELEASLQQFGEFLLRAQPVKESPRSASDEPVADQVRRFWEELEGSRAYQDWQVRQAEYALRIYFVNFLQQTDWHRRPQSIVVDEAGRTIPLVALEELSRELRTAPRSPLDLLRDTKRLLRPLLVLNAIALQDSFHAVIALVAGVLEHRTGDPGHGHAHGPRLHEEGAIGPPDPV